MAILTGMRWYIILALLCLSLIVILSIFSFACWLSVFLLWRDVYLDILPIFKIVFSWAVCIFWKLTSVLLPSLLSNDVYTSANQNTDFSKDHCFHSWENLQTFTDSEKAESIDVFQVPLGMDQWNPRMLCETALELPKVLRQIGPL